MHTISYNLCGGSEAYAGHLYADILLVEATSSRTGSPQESGSL